MTSSHSAAMIIKATPIIQMTWLVSKTAQAFSIQRCLPVEKNLQSIPIMCINIINKKCKTTTKKKTYKAKFIVLASASFFNKTNITTHTKPCDKVHKCVNVSVVLQLDQQSWFSSGPLYCPGEYLTLFSSVLTCIVLAPCSWNCLGHRQSMELGFK